MGEIHNLQVVISQSSVLNRINEAQQNAFAANGSQIINVIDKEMTKRKLSTVRELSKSEKIEKEDPQKRKLKKSSSSHLIDLYS